MPETTLTPESTLTVAAAPLIDAVVVGAGFSGLYMLHRLRRLGLSVQGFEAGDDVGGTWYWNRYPGARCDVVSVDYSYAFDEELDAEWQWSEKYAAQPEILRYVNHVADRFELRPLIRLRTRVVAAVWDEAAGRWTVTTDKGDQLLARYCIMATGCLSTSKTPEVDGLETFQGPWYHTGHWPHEGVDFTGLRVGMVGTGSSGIQSIPVIAAQAAHLTVFQRTANFAMPAKNGPIPANKQEDLRVHHAEYRQAARESGFGVPVVLPTKSALEVDPAERQKNYAARWEEGNLVSLLTAYTDIAIDEEANATAAEFVRSKIREIVTDPEVAELLCPDDHPLGTKRPCLDTNYYATFNRDNVTLVDVRKAPIAEITPTGLRTATDSYEFDALVFATGFDAMTGSINNVDIRGRDGLVLREKWAEGPRTYLGLAVAGFPNLFTITGPGSPSVLSNMMVSIEQHVEWISDCIEHLQARGISSIEATVEAEDEWTGHVQELGHQTLYPRANSWYMGANVPGKPRVFLPYVGGVGVYRQKCDEVAAKDYDGFALAQ
jgi:cation diffusion facilitator CzcD-associated flavoprotein CzcO